MRLCGGTGEPGPSWVLVTTQAPHLIAATSPEWLLATGYAEGDVVGRSATQLLGSGTCLVTTGALWTAVQARSAPLI